MYAKTWQGLRFVWIDAKLEIDVEVVDQGTTPNLKLEVLFFNGTEATGLETVDMANAHMHWTAVNPGWYTFGLQCPSIVPLNYYDDVTVLSMILVAPADKVPQFLAHLPIPGIEQQSLLTAIRVIGASAMITLDGVNSLSGGNAVGLARLSKAVLPENLFINSRNETTTSQLLRNPRAVKLKDAKHGIYGWSKPIEQDCLEWQEPLQFAEGYSDGNSTEGIDAALPQRYNSQMYAPGGWVYLAVNVPSGVVDAATYPALTGRYTCAWSVEYKTESAWVQSQLPISGPRVHDEMLTALAKLPEFTTNSSHIGSLVGDILGVVAGVGAAAAAVGGAAAAWAGGAGVLGVAEALAPLAVL